MPPTIVALISRRAMWWGILGLSAGALLCAWFAASPQSGDSRSLLIVGAVLCCLCALWCWRARTSRLEIGIDEITIHHPTLWEPVTIPRSAITAAAAGDPTDIGWPMTIPAGLPDHLQANMVLELAAPVVIRGFPVRRQRTIDTVAVIAADVDAAAQAVAQLGLPACSPSASEGQPTHRLPTLRAAAIRLVITIAVAGGFAWLKITVDPPPPNTAAEAEKTEGRSTLPKVPSVRGAIAFRAQATDGSLLYAWQTGDRLRVRVDTSAQRCSGGDWREWWWATDRPGIEVAADGSFHDRHHEVVPISTGGVDVADSTIEGRVRRGILTLAFHSRDDYRGAYYNGTCLRDERFSARRSG